MIFIRKNIRNVSWDLFFFECEKVLEFSLFSLIYIYKDVVFFVIKII